MRLAIEEAVKAGRMDEVPVGAVIIDEEDRIISTAHNLTESSADPTAHAEILAIRAAAGYLGSWRLNSCTLYVTLEPCAMCAGAIVNSRIERLVFAAKDKKAGAITSLYRIGSDGLLNHRFETVPGVLSSRSASILKTFFRDIRNRQDLSGKN